MGKVKELYTDCSVTNNQMLDELDLLYNIVKDLATSSYLDKKQIISLCVRAREAIKELS